MAQQHGPAGKEQPWAQRQHGRARKGRGKTGMCCFWDRQLPLKGMRCWQVGPGAAAQASRIKEMAIHALALAQQHGPAGKEWTDNGPKATSSSPSAGWHCIRLKHQAGARGYGKRKSIGAHT
eukprot:1157997-Pelagomonas_calceolata.AAC.3